MANGDNIRAMSASKVLELNPRHPIVANLRDKVEADPDDDATRDAALLVHDIALLSSGFVQDDMDDFTQRMYCTVGKSLDVESFDLLDEIEVEDEDEEEPAAGGEEEFSVMSCKQLCAR